jgi:hypothetical protein
MAYCPKCKGEMGEADVVCPHCGYDFPPEPDSSQRRIGLEYSVWADIALIVGAVVAALGCLGSAFYSVAMVLTREYVQGLVVGPTSFFVSLALLVVFVRIQKV